MRQFSRYAIRFAFRNCLCLVSICPIVQLVVKIYKCLKRIQISYSVFRIRIWCTASLHYVTYNILISVCLGIQHDCLFAAAFDIGLYHLWVKLKLCHLIIRDIYTSWRVGTKLHYVIVGNWWDGLLSEWRAWLPFGGSSACQRTMHAHTQHTHTHTSRWKQTA